MNDSAATVDVLRCAGCGGAVPLGAGDVAACVYCGASVPVPAPLRALRDVERAAAATRVDVERVYARLARPPSLVVRVLGSTALFSAFAWFVAGSAASLAVVLVAAVAQVERALGIDWFDVVPAGARLAYVVAGTYAMLGLPALLGTLAARRADARRLLQQTLAAAPPERAGGPAACRGCFAPLDVAAGAHGCRCVYCRVDNLVVADPAWLGAVTRDTARARVTLADAVAVERRDRRQAIGVGLFRFLYATPVVVVVVLIFAGAPERWVPAWSDAVLAQPRLLYACTSLHCTTREEPVLTTDARAVVPCRGLCRHGFVVALRQGERLSVAVDGAGADGARVTFRAQPIGALFRPLMDLAPPRVLVDGDAPATLIAPHDAYFTVDVDVVGAAALELASYGLTARVDAP